tara:strand:- start:166 stop:1005 length:840 start_codon:yes stop_codon:yes gene_type:complete
MNKFNLSLICLLLSLTGCAFFDKAKIDPYRDMPEAQLYNLGSDFLANADIPQAVILFEMLEARFPFSTYAQQSILDLAFAYYDFGQKDDAIAECDRFIDLYPNHPNLDYAYYLRAISNLEKEQPFFQEFLGQDISKYDVTRLKQAYNDFLLISNKFRGSKYAADAQNRLIFLRNAMANHEVYIAKYYLKRGAFVASSERAKYMLETYPGTPASEDALIVLIDSYNKLGSAELALETAEVLTTNYDNYKYTINKNRLITIQNKNIATVDDEDSFFDFNLF